MSEKGIDTLSFWVTAILDVCSEQPSKRVFAHEKAGPENCFRDDPDEKRAFCQRTKSLQHKSGEKIGVSGLFVCLVGFFFSKWPQKKYFVYEIGRKNYTW